MMNIKMFFLRLWYRKLIKNPDPKIMTKFQLFPLGTKMEFKGRRYRYYKAGKDINVGEPRIEDLT